IIFLIEQNDTVHLTRKSDAAYVTRHNTMYSTFGETGSNSTYRCLPPQLGILFRPTRMRMYQGVIDKSTGYYVSIFGCEKSSFNASSSKIDAQQCLHNHAPLIVVYEVEIFYQYMLWL